jgi:hypothetical protein
LRRRPLAIPDSAAADGIGICNRMQTRLTSGSASSSAPGRIFSNSVGFSRAILHRSQTRSGRRALNGRDIVRVAHVWMRVVPFDRGFRAHTLDAPVIDSVASVPGRTGEDMGTHPHITFVESALTISAVGRRVRRVPKVGVCPPSIRGAANKSPALSQKNPLSTI